MKDHNEANGRDSGKRVLRPRKVASAVENHAPTETIKEVSVKQVPCNNNTEALYKSSFTNNGTQGV